MAALLLAHLAVLPWESVMKARRVACAFLSGDWLGCWTGGEGDGERLRLNGKFGVECLMVEASLAVAHGS